MIYAAKIFSLVNSDMTSKTFIIAEAGVNHNGDMQLAKQLIEVAACSGADMVKFQTFKADDLVTHAAKKADYQNQNTDESESQYQMLRRLELTDDMHRELIMHCNKLNIGFLSTAFDVDSIDQLLSYGQTIFKVPSGEITNMPYLRRVGSVAKSVILSTGMSSLGDIENAISILENAGMNRLDIAIMHCTTEYPAPMIDVNLRAMQAIQAAFGTKVGYSDHTHGIEIPIAAVAMGAEIIEKHFTLNRNLPGPDHKASLEPNELTNMIASIRNIEIALGDGIKRLTPSEVKNKPLSRKSLVAKRRITKGEILTSENMTTKRPGDGISPMRWDDVLGQIASRDYECNELIDGFK